MYFASSVGLGSLCWEKGVAGLSCDYGRKTIWTGPAWKHARKKITSIIFSHLTEVISAWVASTTEMYFNRRCVWSEFHITQISVNKQSHCSLKSIRVFIKSEELTDGLSTISLWRTLSLISVGGKYRDVLSEIITWNFLNKGKSSFGLKVTRLDRALCLTKSSQ
jgi:hypothetical protein